MRKKNDNILIIKTAFIRKLALSRLRKVLKGLSKVERIKAINKLPGGLKETQSYKELGSRVAGRLKRNRGAAGHGSDHVFQVTKHTQGMLKGQPDQIRRRGTLGALLHDIARPAETRVRKRIGKAKFKASKDLKHPELGGRYAKDFLAKNKSLSKNVSGLDRGKLKTVVRAHSLSTTDKTPWLKSYSQKDPAAGAVIMGDKMDALGRRGAERTISFGRELGDAPKKISAFALGQENKYRGAVNLYAPKNKKKELMKEVDTYVSGMKGYGRKKISMDKEAMSVRAYVRVLSKLSSRSVAKKDAVRRLASMIRNSNSGSSDITRAIYMLPAEKRFPMFEVVAESIHKACFR